MSEIGVGLLSQRRCHDGKAEAKSRVDAAGARTCLARIAGIITHCRRRSDVCPTGGGAIRVLIGSDRDITQHAVPGWQRRRPC